MEAVATSANATAVASSASVLLVAPPAEGGLASHVISLLSGLHRDGYQVAVACRPDSRIAAAASERQVPAYAVTCAAEGGPSRVAGRVLRLVRAIGEFRPQIIHAHSFGASAIAAAACTVARSARLVVTIHNYPPGTNTMVPQKAGEPSLPAGWQGWALGMSLQRARRIITVSEALRRDLISAHPELMDKCVTIPNGVETQGPPARPPAEIRAQLDLPAEGPLIGMVARLAPQKGVLDFIRAARIVADRWPSSAFVLAGNGPLRQQAEALRDELGLGPVCPGEIGGADPGAPARPPPDRETRPSPARLHLPGRVERVRDLIHALDLLVVASTSEGSSVVAMEAMALGRPVVATAVGGVPEVVSNGETGILVEPGDPEGLAGAIGELLSDPRRGAEMGERGRARAAGRFDISEMVERTKAVYADLVREQVESGGGRS